MRTDTITRDGILLTGIHHALMAVFFMMITAAVIRFGVRFGSASGSADSFFPLIATAAGIALTAAYIAVAAGVFGRREWARIGGIVLSIVGVGLGLLILFQAVSTGLRSLQPDWSMVIAVAGIAIIIYTAVAVFDLAALLFLVSPRTRAAFSGAAYPVPAPDSLSPLELVASRVLRNPPPPTED